jgi:O-antigen/teichoic acid export membrane protein
VIRQATGRLTWGFADQVISSLTNFAVSIYIARELGAVRFGAFSLAYATYAFALNGSRGLSTDPLMVRFSGTDVGTWRREVANCTGSALVVGMVTGACVLAVAAVLSGTTSAAFLALGLTLPGLMLQDSWRYAFFALGRGSQAFLNDMIWAAVLIPGLVLLRLTGHATVFWCVFVWGASASAAAVVGPLQARVMPVLSGAWSWVSSHRDLGVRWLLEGTSSAAAVQLRATSITLLAGLAALGYVQAAQTLMGPIMVLFIGMSLVTIPEAARVVRRAPRQLPLFCVLVSVGLAAAAAAWGTVLLVAVPPSLGETALGAIWRPAHPLILPTMVYFVGSGFAAGATVGLHALGAAKRSLRAALLASGALLIGAVAGAAAGGAIGAVIGSAVGSWLSVALKWREFRVALREADRSAAEAARHPAPVRPALAGPAPHQAAAPRSDPAHGRHRKAPSR